MKRQSWNIVFWYFNMLHGKSIWKKEKRYCQMCEYSSSGTSQGNLK